MPAKVNLFLSVRGLREDGYHDIVSIMQTVSLYDELEVDLHGEAPACQHPAIRRFMAIAFHHDAGPDVPDDERNLVVRAAHLLREQLGSPNGSPTPDSGVPTTNLTLHKDIPVAGGMAGGSADAAATLLALNRLWDVSLDVDELRSLARHLGADVPFCVQGGTALATGTGTATAQVLSRGTYHWVVGISETPLSTADVYRTFDDVGSTSEVEPDAVLHALRTEDAEALGAALHNDLQAASFHLRPELREHRELFLDAGALGSVVSGSGPTVLALAADEHEAHRIAAEVGGAFDRVAVAASPAGGPELTAASR